MDHYIKQYIVDAFTNQVFKGNPAAVCALKRWLSDSLMQEIACENNLSETAFTVKNGDNYELRWFTPGGEIDLCGHATLGAAFVLLNFYEKEKDAIVFSTKGGKLAVTRHGDLYELDFPAYDLTPVPVTQEMTVALGARPEEAFLGRDLLCVYSDENIVRQLAPDMEKLKGLGG